MKHHIIVKFNETAKQRNSLLTDIETLFRKAEELEGVHKVSVYPSCISLPNRYDLMIVIEMEPEALPVYDSSPMHAEWKKEYASCIEAKAIFDCND